MDGRVTVGRIEQSPIARRQLREEREADIADPPQQGHGAERTGVNVSVAFGVIGLAADNRGNQGRKTGWVHLAIAVHLHDDFSPRRRASR